MFIKGRIHKLVIYLMRSLRKVEQYLDREENLINSSGYEDLGPKDNIGEKYFDAINFAIKNKNIKNTAISGPYGVGKSSIIRSYEKKYKENKYLNISLAHFSSEKIESNEIESNIFKQMFYKVKYNKIGYSRYKRINNLKLSTIVSAILVCIIPISTGISIFKPEIIVDMKEKIILLNSLNISNKIVVIIGIIFFISSILILARCIKFFKANLKIGKINTKNVEIKEAEDNKSIFNKNIEEILYFFQVNKFNVVVFEDIDRFENIDIFIKLRELNELINNSEEINRQVTFVYAMKEDMFKSGKDRTKFFEFIIPIIPTINSSNSIEILIKKLEKDNLYSCLSKEFINDITTYIDDMRILINIYNEFKMYRKNLDNSNLIMNNLFGIIVYKNIYPEDFAKFHLNDGMVARIFKNKKYIEEVIKGIDDEYKRLESLIESVNKEYIFSIDELKSIYLEPLNINRENTKYINGVNYRYYKDFKLDIFSDKFNLDTEVRYDEYGYGTRWISMENISTNNKNESYYEREKIIKLRRDDNIESLKKKLSELKNKRKEVKSFKIKELIENYGVENIIDEETRKEKLIVYLIRNGYIDEMYNFYITYFYPGSITNMDMEFIQSIKNQESLSFYHSLDNIDKVMNRLHLSEFKAVEVLNFDLLDFIIENKCDYHINYKNILEQLSNESNKSIEFIDGYIEVTKKGVTYYTHRLGNIGIFMDDICKVWKGIWEFISTKSNYTKDKKDKYLIDLIEHVEIKSLEEINKNNSLRVYIGESENFLELIINKRNTEKIKELIQRLEVKFKYINKGLNNRVILDHIYEKNLYEINYEMIKLLIKVYSNNLVVEELEICNYSVIKKSKCEKLISYINENINLYIEDVFLKLPSSKNELEENIIELLDKDDIEFRNKELIIGKVDMLINDITKINEKLWGKLIEERKLSINWLNIIMCLDLVSLKSKVIELLNDEGIYIKLSEELIDGRYEMDRAYVENLCDIIISDENIIEVSFENLLRSVKKLCHTYVSHEYFEELIQGYLWGFSIDKLNILINANEIKLTKENYEYIKGRTNEKHTELIENNINVYMEDFNKYSLTSKDVIRLLDSSIITDEQKKYIVNNINIYDIQEGIRDKKLDDCISEFLMKNSDKIELELLEYLLDSEIDINKKVRILSEQIIYLDDDNISALLRTIKGEYEYIADKGRTPLLKNNEVNKELVKKLENKEYISSWNIKDGRIKVNKKKKLVQV